MVLPAPLVAFYVLLPMLGGANIRVKDSRAAPSVIERVG